MRLYSIVCAAALEGRFESLCVPDAPERKAFCYYLTKEERENVIITDECMKKLRHMFDYMCTMSNSMSEPMISYDSVRAFVMATCSKEPPVRAVRCGDPIIFSN